MKNLKVKIDLQKSSAVLLTQRLIKQSLISFFSNLAGSVLGIMSLIGFIMNMIEPRYEDYMRTRRNRRTIKEIIYTGNHIKKVNFDRLKLGHIDSNAESRTLDQKATMDNMVNISFQNTSQNETVLDTNREVRVINRRLYNEVLNGGDFIFKKSRVVPFDP